MRLPNITILLLILAGFGLRLHYLTTTHPFFDEYTTVLAARQILQYGWPVLPSGLFYEHGLLATYLIAPFTALFIHTPLADWQPAHWGLMLSRWPSTLLGTLTIPLIFALGRRHSHPLTLPVSHPPNLPTSQPLTSHPTALLAAGLFAFSPEGLVWGGRARMYALATLLVLLTVYWAYRGAIYPAPAKYRWWALLALLATLLTQFGAMILVPPLVISMLAVGWYSAREAQRRKDEEMRAQKKTIPQVMDLGRVSPHVRYTSRFTFHVSRVWFLRPSIFGEGLALLAVVGLAIFMKRLGQPLGAVALGSPASGNLPAELLETITYQTAVAFTWPDLVDFLARQFGPPYYFWLSLVTLISAGLGLSLWLIRKVGQQRDLAAAAQRGSETPDRRGSPTRIEPRPYNSFTLFLWLVFGLIILEMVTLLDPFRRNPRYLVMYMPLFYLIAAASISYLLTVIRGALSQLSARFSSEDRNLGELRGTYRNCPHEFPQVPPNSYSSYKLALILLALFVIVGLPDLRVALVTPEPAYEEAFALIQQNWQPGDVLLTMNTPAAGLYLKHADGFTVQREADQFLLNRETAPVDRWLGAPWIGTAVDLHAALNTAERVWFVIDTIRQPVYFQGDWQAVINSQMEQVWAKDNALIYRTRSDRIPLPTQPTTLLHMTLDDAIELIGYTLPAPAASSTQAAISSHPSPLHLTLFWRPLKALATDYTVFLHLRNSSSLTVAQYDGLPLAGAYPTSRWQPAEIVIDPVMLQLPPNLPAGRYTLWGGMYQLETLERLPVVNDTSGENAILLGEIVLP